MCRYYRIGQVKIDRQTVTEVSVFLKRGGEDPSDISQDFTHNFNLLQSDPQDEPFLFPLCNQIQENGDTIYLSIFITGTVNMILHAKMAMRDWKWYPLKLCLIKYKSDIKICLSFAKVTCEFLALKGNGKTRNKYFSESEKRLYFPQF